MFREFKVGELFDGSTGDTDLKKEHLDGQGYPVVTAGVDNLGIAGYSSTNAKVLPANTLTVDMFGNCYFRPFEYKMVTHARVFSLSLKDGQLTPETGLYICTMFNWLRSKYNYSNMCSYNKIKAETIQLPVKPGTDEVNYTEDDIDWHYMESYIQELEESYIQELDAYLKETGLDDYTLTDDEREVLEREPVFKEFEVGGLFDGVSGDTDIKKVHLDGDGYPVITAGVDNLGVAGYSSVTAKILPANTLTVDMFGNCYFRPFEYKMVTHARVFSLSLKNGHLTPETGLFICTMLKWLSTKYNYSNMCSYNKIKNETIQLPVKSGTDDDIDWDYMASYVRTMEKQVIADVVDYKNEMISTTKALVKKIRSTRLSASF